MFNRFFLLLAVVLLSLQSSKAQRNGHAQLQTSLDQLGQLFFQDRLGVRETKKVLESIRITSIDQAPTDLKVRYHHQVARFLIRTSSYDSAIHHLNATSKLIDNENSHPAKVDESLLRSVALVGKRATKQALATLNSLDQAELTTLQRAELLRIKLDQTKAKQINPRIRLANEMLRLTQNGSLGECQENASIDALLLTAAIQRDISNYDSAYVIMNRLESLTAAKMEGSPYHVKLSLARLALMFVEKRFDQEFFDELVQLDAHLQHHMKIEWWHQYFSRWRQFYKNASADLLTDLSEELLYSRDYIVAQLTLLRFAQTHQNSLFEQPEYLDAMGKEVDILKMHQAFANNVDKGEWKGLYYLVSGAALRENRQYDEAMVLAEKSIEYFAKTDDQKRHGDSHVLTASIEIARSNFERARELLDKVKDLELPPRVRWRWLDLRQVLAEQEGPAAVRQVFEEKKAVAASDKVLSRSFILILLDQTEFLMVTSELDSARVLLDELTGLIAKGNANRAMKFNKWVLEADYHAQRKDFPNLLEALLKIELLNNREREFESQARYLRYWNMLYHEAPAPFLSTHRKDFLYSENQLLQRLNALLPRLQIDEKILTLESILAYHKRQSNWKLTTEISEEIRSLENEVFQEEVRKSLRKENELITDRARAQEQLQQAEIDLRNEDLARARTNQYYLIAIVLAILVFSYYVYRTSLIRKKQNAMLASQKRDIERMGEMKSKFFINISHELRTPLTLVIGHIRNNLTGRYGKLNDRQRKSLATAGANSNRILGLVQDMLDLSKLESGNETLKTRPVELEKEVRAVLKLFEVQVEERQLEVDIKCSIDTPKVYADPLKLETVLFNLIGNAIKHSFEVSRLAIEIHEDDTHQSISVRNAGTGIPESDLPFVFDRFFQSGSSGSGEGSGVGLALTKELIDLHQGSIEVTSTINESTCFKVSLLKGTEHLADDQIIEREEMMGEEFKLGDTVRVLVVDDNADMRHYLYELLSQYYQISLAENGQDALNRIEEIKPHLVLTDYMMPQMNGVKFFRAMRKLEGFRDVPIIFLTARAIERDKITLFNEGVDDYILKPFNDKELFSRINTLLDLKGERAKHKIAEPKLGDELENKFLNLLRSAIFKAIQDPGLTPASLAIALSVSERTLYRKVKAGTGFTPQAYIKEIRLQEARRLIEDKVYDSISDVAYAVGFEHLSNFSRSYKKRFGTSASNDASLQEAS